MSEQRRDDIYARTHGHLVDFVFDERVARVFPDMIRRSIPGYDALLPLLGLFAENFAQPDSHCYDLGCSLGASTVALARHVDVPGCKIIAVDNAQAMVDGCRENIAAQLLAVPVEVHCADIRALAMERASVVVLNFTLQFLPPNERLALLRRVYRACLPGAVLVLAEKIRFDDPGRQAFAERMHLLFKQANGYSQLEISQKRSALENVLIPDSLAVHHARLQEAGFAAVHTWFQCFNFAAVAAIK